MREVLSGSYLTGLWLWQLCKSVQLQHKEVDDVLGGDDAWKNVQKTDGRLHA